MKRSIILSTWILFLAVPLGFGCGSGGSADSTEADGDTDTEAASDIADGDTDAESFAADGDSDAESATLDGDSDAESSAADGDTDTGTCGDATDTYTASGTDETAILVDNATKTIANATVTSTSVTSSDDNSSFYGLNAAVLAKNGGKLTMSCASVSTTGEGANGVFSTGSGSYIKLTDVTISCTGGGGHGVDATVAGTMDIENVTITTSGAHGAAIATDRGGGTINVTGGSFTTTGTDSPGIYSTGTITVKGATIDAKGAEAGVIEGANSITLTDTAMTAAKGSRDRGIMVYQSMSGDAEGNKGVFTATGGSYHWTSTSGPAIFVTNTTAILTFKGVAMTNDSSTLLKAGADQWGTSGSNGGDVTFTADSETLTGDVVADSVSKISVILQNGTTLNGALTQTALTLDATSSWTVRADSTLTCLSDTAGISGTSIANIKAAGGITVTYDSTACGALGAITYTLNGGGTLKPAAK